MGSSFLQFDARHKGRAFGSLKLTSLPRGVSRYTIESPKVEALPIVLDQPGPHFIVTAVFDLEDMNSNFHRSSEAGDTDDVELDLAAWKVRYPQLSKSATEDLSCTVRPIDFVESTTSESQGVSSYQIILNGLFERSSQGSTEFLSGKIEVGDATANLDDYLESPVPTQLEQISTDSECFKIVHDSDTYRWAAQSLPLTKELVATHTGSSQNVRAHLEEWVEAAAECNGTWMLKGVVYPSEQFLRERRGEEYSEAQIEFVLRGSQDRDVPTVALICNVNGEEHEEVVPLDEFEKSQATRGIWLRWRDWQA